MLKMILSISLVLLSTSTFAKHKVVEKKGRSPASANCTADVTEASEGDDIVLASASLAPHGDFLAGEIKTNNGTYRVQINSDKELYLIYAYEEPHGGQIVRTFGKLPLETVVGIKTPPRQSSRSLRVVCK